MAIPTDEAERARLKGLLFGAAAVTFISATAVMAGLSFQTPKPTEVVPLPPGTKPVNAPLFALKAFAAGTLLCAVGSSAAVLAYAYATDTWSIEQFGDRMRKEIPPRAQKIRDWMAPLRKRLGTDQPRPSDGADGSEGFPWK